MLRSFRRKWSLSQATKRVNKGQKVQTERWHSRETKHLANKETEKKKQRATKDSDCRSNHAAMHNQSIDKKLYD